MGGHFSSGRRAFHFHTCPFFQQRESSCVVEVLVPVLTRNFINLFDGFKRRQFNPSLFSGFQGKVDVLVHQAEGEIGREVTFQDKGRLVIHYARADHRGLDQREHSRSIHSQLGGQRQS